MYLFTLYNGSIGVLVRAKSPSAARKLAATVNGDTETWNDVKRTSCEVVEREGAPGVLLVDYYEE